MPDIELRKLDNTLKEMVRSMDRLSKAIEKANVLEQRYQTEQAATVPTNETGESSG